MPVSLQTVDRFMSFAISFLALQISKKPFMSDPSFLLYLRVAFGVSMCLQLAFAYIIKRKIVAKKDNPSDVFKMQPEASLFSDANESAGEVEVNAKTYDLGEIDKLIQSTGLYLLIISLIHWKWGMVQPLLIQVTTFLRNICFNPLFYEYIYGVKMERPFSKNMLFNFSKKTTTTAAAAPARSTPKKEKEE